MGTALPAASPRQKCENVVLGGRMVKWLCEIEITDKESDNFYHFNDNRVLPSMIDAERATAEKWWFKPEYIINRVSVAQRARRPVAVEVHHEGLRVQRRRPEDHPR